MARSLEEWITIVSANNPEVRDDFIDLLRPDHYDRVEMGSIYEESLGYNPITYYDEQEALSYLRYLEKQDNVADEVKEYIKENRHDIAETVIESQEFADDRSSMIHVNIQAYLEEETGCGIDVNDPEDELDDEMDEEEEEVCEGIQEIEDSLDDDD